MWQPARPRFLADDLETAARIARLVGRHAAFAREHLERACEFAARLLGRTGAAVEHADSHAGGRGHLRDAAAHGAGADNTQRKIAPVDINHLWNPRKSLQTVISHREIGFRSS